MTTSTFAEPVRPDVRVGVCGRSAEASASGDGNAIISESTSEVASAEFEFAVGDAGDAGDAVATVATVCVSGLFKGSTFASAPAFAFAFASESASEPEAETVPVRLEDESSPVRPEDESSPGFEPTHFSLDVRESSATLERPEFRAS